MSWNSPGREALLAGCGKRLLWAAVAAGLLASSWTHAAPVREIFVARGDHGEVSFTDVERPGARRVTVNVTEPPADALEQMERRIEQTLRVAHALEQSRLAREAARTAARRSTALPPALATDTRGAVGTRHVTGYLLGPDYFHRRYGPSRHKHEPEPRHEPAERILVSPLLRRTPSDGEG